VDHVSDTEATGMTGRPDAAEARLQELLDERARLWEELHRLRAERREVAYYEALAVKMQSSVSWRVTAPLRAAKTLAAKIRKHRSRRS
jgi:hypothetical protein